MRGYFLKSSEMYESYPCNIWWWAKSVDAIFERIANAFYVGFSGRTCFISTDLAHHPIFQVEILNVECPK